MVRRWTGSGKTPPMVAVAPVQREFRHGLAIGTFLPPHAGHHALIEHAAERCERLTIVVCDLPGQIPDSHDRATWLQAAHPDAAVVVVPDICVWHGPTRCPPACSAMWAEHLATFTPPRFDLVCTSESYGPLLAVELGATHVPFDPSRRAVPVSAAEIRANLRGHWFELDDVTRAGMYRRVGVIGAESTGTTTLCRDLARHLGAPGTHEAGRIMSWSLASAVGGFEKVEWTEHDFYRILEEQRRLEASAVARAVDRRPGPLGPWLVCDTDALATVVWWERYLATPPAPALAYAEARLADVYLVTSPHDVPFLQDGVRDGEHVRFEMHRRFVHLAASTGRPWRELTGDPTDRLSQAVDLLAEVESANPRFATGH
jgi:HTH-type transcriptional regulator, transcriptional repressor of NAD biosynthesis genes